MRRKEFWKPFWSVFLEYLNHPEFKMGGNIGILERKHVNVTGIVHIGKESNNLEESEFLGVESGSYEMYENLENLDARFRKIAPRILNLKPKDVKKIGVSKQTLWNVKEKIKQNKLNTVSNKIKINLLLFYNFLF